MTKGQYAAMQFSPPRAGATLFNSQLAARYSLLPASLLALVTAFGCGRRDDLSPPQVRYGETECDHCKMIVSDEPFAAAACVSADGGVHKIVFDDVGCLLDHLRANPAPAAMYVHDFKTLRWVPAAQAYYVRSDKLRTPMASNLAACGARDEAEALLAQYPGEVLSFEALRRPKSAIASTSRSSP